MSHHQLDIIGRAERVDVLSLGLRAVPAKVDTGADNSAIWASRVVEQSDGSGLHCVFFGPGSPYYTGEVVRIAQGYTVTRVANSFGKKELRYKLKLRIKVKGRLIRATFTLSDRSLKTYPILLGRRLLQNKFLVDVSQGDSLREIETSKAQNLAQTLQLLNEKREGL